jgi:hypothetical protein
VIVLVAPTLLFGVIPAKAGTQRLFAGSKTLGSGLPLRGVRNDEG